MKHLKENLRFEKQNKIYLFRIQSKSKRPMCKTKCYLHIFRCFCVSIPLFSNSGWYMKNKYETNLSSVFECKEDEFGIKSYNNNAENNKNKLGNLNSFKSSINCIFQIKRPRFIITILYIIAFIYILPQFFEKKIVCHTVDFIQYCFIDYSEFGKKVVFQKIYHLYLFAFIIFIFPFILILTSNYILLRAFIKSKKRFKKNKFYFSPQVNGPTGQSEVYRMFEHQTVISQLEKIRPVKMNSKVNKKMHNKNLGLTLSLFGVVFLFLICQLPQIVSRIMTIRFPQNSVLKDSKISLILLNISNFFVMLNSSINFIPYIAFGPRKFRKKFSNIFKSPFKILRDYFKKS